MSRTELDRGTLDTLMGLALDEARSAAGSGEVPVGAVVVRLADGVVVARRHNERERAADPTAHAEVLALRDAAAAAGTWRLDGHALVVTLEPCPMCAGAAVAARLRPSCSVPPTRRPARSAACTTWVPTLGSTTSSTVTDGVRAEECGALLREFFAEQRPS